MPFNSLYIFIKNQRNDFQGAMTLNYKCLKKIVIILWPNHVIPNCLNLFSFNILNQA